MKDHICLVNILIFKAPLCMIIVKQWLKSCDFHITRAPPQHFPYF